MNVFYIMTCLRYYLLAAFTWSSFIKSFTPLWWDCRNSENFFFFRFVISGWAINKFTLTKGSLHLGMVVTQLRLPFNMLAEWNGASRRRDSVLKPDCVYVVCLPVGDMKPSKSVSCRCTEHTHQGLPLLATVISVRGPYLEQACSMRALETSHASKKWRHAFVKVILLSECIPFHPVKSCLGETTYVYTSRVLLCQMVVRLVLLCLTPYLVGFSQLLLSVVLYTKL